MEEVKRRIEEILRSHPVVLFMKGTPDFPQCGFSAQAVQVLEACGVQFAHYNVLEDPELREALKGYANWPTYPQLYLKGRLVGGSDIMVQLYRSGELQKMLQEALASSEEAP